MFTAGIIAAGLAAIGGGATLNAGAGDRIERLAGFGLAVLGFFMAGAGFLVTFTAGGF